MHMNLNVTKGSLLTLELPFANLIPKESLWIQHKEKQPRTGCRCVLIVLSKTLFWSL